MYKLFLSKNVKYCVLLFLPIFHSTSSTTIWVRYWRHSPYMSNCGFDFPWVVHGDSQNRRIETVSRTQFFRVPRHRLKLKFVRNMEEERSESFPLHRAVEYRIVHKINILLPKTKDINKKNDKGYSVFLLACELRDFENILDILLARKDIDITVSNNEGFNALHILAYNGNFKALVKVLKAFPDVDINAKNDKGNTPLMMACKKNYVRIMEYLLAKGADMAIQNHKKYTALQYAANNGYTECVELLIEYGADPNGRDDYGLTPLMKASKWGFVETCETLLKNGADINLNSRYMTALSCSCFNDTVELTKLLIRYGANVNFPGPYSSPLIACSKLGSYECAKELIKAGAKRFGRLKDGKCAADFAEERGFTELAKLLSG